MTASVRVTADLLATARYIAVANLAFFVLSAQWRGDLFLFQILLAAWLLYLHVRIYFDQLLFIDLLYQKLSAEELDGALDALNLKKIGENRPLAERAQSAVRFWKFLLYGTGAQLVLLFLQF